MMLLGWTTKLRLVKEYWSGKPESERLVVMLSPRARAHEMRSHAHVRH